MPPKRKRQKKAIASTQKSQDDSHESFRETSRDALIGKLKEDAQKLDLDDEEDLDRLTSSVRALISMNKEIWERCSPNFVRKDQAKSTVVFVRDGFASVQVTADEADDATTVKDQVITIDAISVVSKQDFPQPPTVPEVLCNIFAAPTESIKPREVLLDYTDYLAKTAWLQDEVSKPFLIILKNHLKEVQVSLGEIETWLMEVNHALSFINKEFGMSLTSSSSGLGLKTIPITLDGRISMKFAIASEIEQAKLKRFLHFIDPINHTL